MKKFCLLQLFLSCFLTGIETCTSQTIITNDKAYTVPASGAMLDVKDTHKGFLPPRVSLSSVTDVVTIPSPATGLLVYNTNASITGGSGTGYFYFNGSQWQGFSVGMHYIGEQFEGGKIFWLDGLGQHGLTVALTDQADTNTMFGWSILMEAFADGIEAGYTNTMLISTITGPSLSYAAVACSQMTVTSGGNTFAGWYLPSKYELNILYNNRAAIGGFSLSNYWSSSEASSANGWNQTFSTGKQSSVLKIVSGHVRCIRKF
jgi:hypothetical protein